jgi:hypothetical protein
MTYACGNCDAPVDMNSSAACTCGHHCPVPVDPIDNTLPLPDEGGLGNGFARGYEPGGEHNPRPR